VPLVTALGNEKRAQQRSFFWLIICRMKTIIIFFRGMRAGLVHLLASLVVAGLVAAVVFGLWFPDPYREMVGGTELFLLVIAVDVVCGPLLTAVLYNPAKPKKELAIDLTLVVFIQLAALVYGLYTVVQARPIYAVFEVDRLRVVSIADVSSEDWVKARAPWNEPHWGAPKLIAVRSPTSGKEKLESIDLALAGKDVAVRPDWWIEWDEKTSAMVLARARDLTDLRPKLSVRSQAALDEAVARSGLPPERLRSLPITSFKNTDWVALIDNQTAKPVAYAPVDGF
jgi:hypothetical protein